MPAAAGAVCTGAFYGDKVSPLSDSPVITATVCEVPLMDGIRHALISTGPAYLISLVFYFVYGLRYSGGSVGGEVYEDILSTVSAEFWLSPVLLLPVLVVVVLILMKKPTIPTFIAGIAAGAVMAMLCQGVSLHDILTVMYSGFSADTGSDVVNSMLNRGGFTSMLSTIGLLIAAGIFGAIAGEEIRRRIGQAIVAAAGNGKILNAGNLAGERWYVESARRATAETGARGRDLILAHMRRVLGLPARERG